MRLSSPGYCTFYNFSGRLNYLSQEQIIFLVTAKFGSHFFGGSLHESRIKVTGVFGTNVLTTHTTDTAVFIGLAWIGFVDRAHRTTGSTNPAFIATVIGFGLERNIHKGFVCSMTSGRLGRTEEVFTYRMNPIKQNSASGAIPVRFLFLWGSLKC